MNYDLFLNRDITIHTTSHSYRGKLSEINYRNKYGLTILKLSVEIDEVWINAETIEAITVHGMEQF